MKLNVCQHWKTFRRLYPRYQGFEISHRFSDRLLHGIYILISGIFCAPADKIYSNQASNQWFKNGNDLTEKNLNLEPNTKPAKNVILFLGMKMCSFICCNIAKPVFPKDLSRLADCSFDPHKVNFLLLAGENNRAAFSSNN